MPDYQKMYFHMANALEKAARILIAAQQECEEIYIRAPDTEIITLPEREECDETQKTTPDE